MDSKEKEAMLSQKRKLVVLDNLLSNNSIKISDLEDILPGGWHINDGSNFLIKHIPQSSLDMFGLLVSEKEAKEDPNFTYNLVHPECTKRIIPSLEKFIQKDDEHDSISLFQRLYNEYEEKYIWTFSSCKLIREKNVFFSLTIPLYNLEMVMATYDNVLKEQAFLKSNYEKFMSLTKREKSIFSLIVNDHKRSEIAENLGIKVQTVDVHRKNINRKIGTSRKEWILYAKAFGMLKD